MTLVGGSWVPWTGSLWHKRAGRATLRTISTNESKTSLALDQWEWRSLVRHCQGHTATLPPSLSPEEKVRRLAFSGTGMAWLCYGGEAIWISHKVVRAGILYWQVIIYCPLRSDNSHTKLAFLPEFIKLPEELGARALQNGKVNEVFQ